MREEQNVEEFSLDSTQMQVQKKQNDSSPIRNYTVPITLVLLGFYFLIFAIVQLITNYSQNSYSISMSCSQTICTGITDSISFADSQKVYVYLTNPKLTQNDIQYTAYQTSDQISSCHSYTLNQQMQKTQSITGTSLSSTSEAFPCGQFISSYPQGSFTFTNVDTSQSLSILTQNLSIFQNSFANQNTSTQWADVENSRFKIWTQSNVGIGLYKYWGYINPTVSGTFQILLQTNNPMTSDFKTDLSVIMTDNKAFSGYNLSCCIFNFIVGLFQFTFGCFSFWIKSKYKQNVKQKPEAQNMGEETQVIIKVPKVSF